MNPNVADPHKFSTKNKD